MYCETLLNMNIAFIDSSTVPLLLEKISPVLSALIAAYFSYVLANQKNINSQKNKEYDYLVTERDNIRNYFNLEITALREQNKLLLSDLSSTKEALAVSRDNEKECLLKLTEFEKIKN
jgi:hypothetical protein